jgi:hypothetical protein
LISQSRGLGDVYKRQHTERTRQADTRHGGSLDQHPKAQSIMLN